MCKWCFFGLVSAETCLGWKVLFLGLGTLGPAREFASLAGAAQSSQVL